MQSLRKNGIFEGLKFKTDKLKEQLSCFGLTKASLIKVSASPSEVVSTDTGLKEEKEEIAYE